MRSVLYCVWVSGGVIAACAGRSTGAEPEGGRVRFNRDIRPILSSACFRCHGADANAREGELRLDQRASAVADRGDYRVIVPGSPDESELIRRVTTKDESERMPPPDERRKLSKADVELLRRWIREGAPYERHWAFIPPRRPSIPPVTMARWPHNAIDFFVLAKLEREGLGPSPEADKVALIRRVTLDVTGLPPTPAEVAAFLADTSPDAYEKLVDRLLASPRYGEHMARYWLDAARYADSNGYFTDAERSMWLWRDWVIAAFNANMPFDQFTVEQLAGDLLPHATRSQRIASGFNRNHMINNETGSIPEEFRVEYVADRLKTTSTVWLGLTIGCARCHDHKFDPISQRDFYRFFAFFNNVPEKGIDGSKGNAAPLLRVPSPAQERTLALLEAELARARSAYKKFEQMIAAGQAEWEKKSAQSVASVPSEGLVVHFPFDSRDVTNFRAKVGTVHVPEDVSFGAGVVGGAVRLDSGKPVTAAVDFAFGNRQPFSLGVWIHSKTSAGCIVSKTNDSNAFRGFDLSLRKGRLLFHLIHRWKDNAIEVATRDTLATGRWHHVTVTYDGSGRASGVKIFVNGKRQPVDVNVDSLTGSVANDEPLRIGRRQSSASFEGRIDDLRIYRRVLSEREVFEMATGQLIRGVSALPRERREPDLARRLTEYWIDHHAPSAIRTSRMQLAALQERRDAFEKTIPTVMVMQEMASPRDTFVLIRGEYDRHGEKVTAGVPATLGALPDNAPRNRLGFARWLVSRQNPLTARVTVNRLWQQFFGTGIVRTTGDFGTQGEWPSHPGLLDWLAVEFMESGWDLKHLVRLIVQSAAYRQRSSASLEQFTADPLNRKLARGPRFRLDAEAIRDQALAASGLLVEKLGGPSVRPYQPPGLWKAVSYDGQLEYEPSTGGDLYRRSLYTFWKRQSPPPNMLAFDAGSRETCSVRRSRTNTPLQALVLMNDPVFLEAAVHLALRALRESPSQTATQRARYAFRLVVVRQPEADELRVLTTLYQQQLQRFRENPRAAQQLLTSVNCHCAPDERAELAAWTTVANLILSLDETITRN